SCGALPRPRSVPDRPAEIDVVTIGQRARGPARGPADQRAAQHAAASETADGGTAGRADAGAAKRTVGRRGTAACQQKAKAAHQNTRGQKLHRPILHSWRERMRSPVVWEFPGPAVLSADSTARTEEWFPRTGPDSAAGPAMRDRSGRTPARLFRGAVPGHSPPPSRRADGDRSMEFLTASARNAVPLTPLTTAELTDWLDGQPPEVRAWLEAGGFTAKPDTLARIPDERGRLSRVVAGVGDPNELWSYGDLAAKLGTGTYALDRTLTPEAATRAAIGWALGTYRF